jgi:hypothetical protein
MKNLKYIKLFEAFDSSKLSGVISYVKNKDKFIDVLKVVCNSIDFPYSKLSNDLFEYLPFKKALNKKAINQDKGEISLIKFWFDIDGNYLEMTAVDGIMRVYGYGSLDSDIKSYTLGKELSDQDYDDIPAETIVRMDIDGATLVGEIYIQDDSRYIIQNKKDGSSPYASDWKTIAKYSWSLSRSDFRRNAYILIPNAKEKEKEYDPYLHNSLLRISNNRFNISKDDVRVIKSAHFSLILDIKKLKESEFTDIKSTKRARDDSKKDSLALKSDQDIKSENIKRYFDKISKNTNISGNLDDLKNVDKVISRLLGGKNMFYFIHNKDRTDSVDSLESVSSNMFDIFRGLDEPKHSEETRTRAINYLVNSTNDILSGSISYNSSINTTINNTIRFIDKRIDSNYREVFDLLNKLVDTVYKHISSYKVKTLDDFEMVLQEVNFIRQLLLTRRYRTFKELDRYFSRIQQFEPERNYDTFIDLILSVNINALKSEIETIDRVIKKHVIK